MVKIKIARSARKHKIGNAHIIAALKAAGAADLIIIIHVFPLGLREE